MPPSDWPCSTTTRRASALGSAAPTGATLGSTTTRGAVPPITTGAGFCGLPAQAATRPANAITGAARMIPCRRNVCSPISPSLPPPGRKVMPWPVYGHSRESGNPGGAPMRGPWIPAFAGITGRAGNVESGSGLFEDPSQGGQHRHVGQVEVDWGDRDPVAGERGDIGSGLGLAFLASRADPVIGPAARIDALGQIVGDRPLALAGDREPGSLSRRHTGEIHVEQRAVGPGQA